VEDSGNEHIKKIVIYIYLGFCASNPFLQLYCTNITKKKLGIGSPLPEDCPSGGMAISNICKLLCMF